MFMNSGSDRTKNTDTGGQSSGRSGVSSAASVTQEKWCIRYRCDTNISGLPALDRPRVGQHAEILSRRDRSLSPRPFYQGWQASKRNENSFGKRLRAFLAVLQFFLLSLSPLFVPLRLFLSSGFFFSFAFTPFFSRARWNLDNQRRRSLWPISRLVTPMESGAERSISKEIHSRRIAFIH